MDKQLRKVLLVGAIATLVAIIVVVVRAVRHPSWSELDRF
jgi:hypothetical protein